jgi:hypothetical protein
MMMSANMEAEIDDISLQKPHWFLLFFIVGWVILIVIGLSLTMLTGLSGADDRVFAVEALVAGLLTEGVFRKVLRKRLVFAESIPIPFLYTWPLICMYVFLFQPLD